MKYYNIVALVFILIISSCKSHDKNVDTIQFFLIDLKKSPINYTYLVNRYTIVNTHKDSIKRVEWVKLNLTMLHNYLVTVPDDKLIIKPYKDLSLKDQTFFSDNKELDKTYGVVIDKKPVNYILIRENKIAAVMAMNKGGTRVFLEL